MTVALRLALARVDAESGTVLTIAWALATTLPFVVAAGDFDVLDVWPFVLAVRDNFVRWLAIDTSVDPALAAAATLGAGGACVLVYLLVRGRSLSARAVPAFLPAGVLFGLSYV